MQIILLSGGSGSRLWPLSNDARSKQFLKILPKEDSDEKESMIQRTVRQIRESGIKADITIATSNSQIDAVTTQIEDDVNIVAEPKRRHTFPAICLACEYLAKVKGCDSNEPVIVMPCDPLTETGYYRTVTEMSKEIETNSFDLILMGIKPIYPSAKYGYILPENSSIAKTHKAPEEAVPVKRFVEKPSVAEALELIEHGALWNAGVFAFRLGFMTALSDKYFKSDSYDAYLANYEKFPHISFDYEVAEKAQNMGVMPFMGFWKDLGTWNTLTDELPSTEFGNIVTDGSSVNTHVFNELSIPMLVLGTNNLVIAASPDGIIVSEKRKSENVKHYAGQLKSRPMFEERRWGTYKVIDSIEFPDKFSALTKQLTLKPGKCISYQSHACRDEVWTFIDGEGEIVLDGVRKPVKRGDVINIPKGQKHALRATSSLTFIEVQHGSNLIEEDIERFPYEW